IHVFFTPILLTIHFDSFFYSLFREDLCHSHLLSAKSDSRNRLFAMHMIKKEQVDLQDQFVQNQKQFIYQLFGLTG
ncbi:hypothetical protein P4415_06255, partial [Bacillus thuringiensis]